MNGRKNTTGMIIIAIGALVASAGKAIGGRWGAGITGFGLAHVALGLLDMFRPVVNE